MATKDKKFMDPLELADHLVKLAEKGDQRAATMEFDRLSEEMETFTDLELGLRMATQLNPKGWDCYIKSMKGGEWQPYPDIDRLVELETFEVACALVALVETETDQAKRLERFAQIRERSADDASANRGLQLAMRFNPRVKAWLDTLMASSNARRAKKPGK